MLFALIVGVAIVIAVGVWALRRAAHQAILQTNAAAYPAKFSEWMAWAPTALPGASVAQQRTAAHAAAIVAILGGATDDAVLGATTASQLAPAMADDIAGIGSGSDADAAVATKRLLAYGWQHPGVSSQQAELGSSERLLSTSRALLHFYGLQTETRVPFGTDPRSHKVISRSAWNATESCTLMLTSERLVGIGSTNVLKAMQDVRALKAGQTAVPHRKIKSIELLADRSGIEVHFTSVRTPWRFQVPFAGVWLEFLASMSGVQPTFAPPKTSAAVQAPAAPPHAALGPPQFASALPQVASGPPQFASALPQVASGPPQFASGPPQIASGPPRFASGPPQIASGPPQFASGPPQIASAPPQFASGPPQIASGPPQFASGPPQIASGPPHAASAVLRPPAAVSATGGSVNVTTKSGAVLQVSADRARWWDGAAWRDKTTATPPSADRSDDGYYWWDGASWCAVVASGAGR